MHYLRLTWVGVLVFTYNFEIPRQLPLPKAAKPFKNILCSSSLQPVPAYERMDDWAVGYEQYPFA